MKTLTNCINFGDLSTFRILFIILYRDNIVHKITARTPANEKLKIHKVPIYKNEYLYLLFIIVFNFYSGVRQRISLANAGVLHNR